MTIHELSDDEEEMVCQNYVMIENFKEFSGKLSKRLKEFNEKNGTDYSFRVEQSEITTLDDIFQILEEQLN